MIGFLNIWSYCTQSNVKDVQNSSAATVCSNNTADASTWSIELVPSIRHYSVIWLVSARVAWCNQQGLRRFVSKWFDKQPKHTASMCTPASDSGDQFGSAKTWWLRQAEYWDNFSPHHKTRVNCTVYGLWVTVHVIMRLKSDNRHIPGFPKLAVGIRTRNTQIKQVSGPRQRKWGEINGLFNSKSTTHYLSVCAFGTPATVCAIALYIQIQTMDTSRPT